MKPDPKHIAAVQDGISGWPIGTGYYATQVGTDEAWDIATGLLTSTDPAVLDALQDALVRAGRLHKMHKARYDIVATDEDGRKTFQHGGDDPWRLRQALADHPHHYLPGSRVEQRIARWLTTDTTGEWERWEPVP